MNSVESSVPASRPVRLAARREVMLGLYAVGLLNGAVAEAMATAAHQSLAEAAGALFGIDPVTLMAGVIGLLLTAAAGPEPAGRRDLMAGLGFAAVVVLPHGSAGWLALGLLGLYGLLGQRRDGMLAAAGAVYLAVSLYEVWARLVLAVLTPQLTRADAALTALVLGAERSGNVIAAPAGYDLAIVAACTSFLAVGQGLLAAFAYTRFLRPAWRWSELRTWAVLALLLVAVNIARLVLCGLSPAFYAHLHDGIGRLWFGLAVLALSLAVAAMGVRHERRSSASRP